MKRKWDTSRSVFLLGAALAIIVSFIFLLLSFQKLNHEEQKELTAHSPDPLRAEISPTCADSLLWVVAGWHSMEQKVLWGELHRNEACSIFVLWDSRLKTLLSTHSWSSADRCFPLPGYTCLDIGKKHRPGDGYVPEGYDFFDGNRHGGHPAQDIFVKDRDQNSRDDVTGSSIPVVSVSSGLVVSLHTGWEPGSEIRGGNYIYIYDPWTNGYYYYAHLDSLKVQMGQRVTCGEKIATLGRSGKNAYPKRSLTHLHLMYLASTPEGPVPRNLHDELCRAKKVNEGSISSTGLILANSGYHSAGGMTPVEIDSASSETLVDITEINPNIQVDLKYSTEDNFLHADLYGEFDKCFLQEEVASMLSEAQKLLTLIKPGYKLIVYDCLRPRSLQRRMWNLVRGTDKESYVANPQKGSMHNYGAAVDLSIVDEKGNPIDMGTAFDDFEEMSQPRMELEFRHSNKLSSKQVANRLLLRMVMVESGFIWIDNEWWHFNAGTEENIRKKYKPVE